MPATDLRFFKRLPVTTALRFNEIPPPGVDIYSTATIDASVTVAVTPNLTTRVGYLATIDAAVDVGLEANLLAYYDNAVNRAPHLNAAAAWEIADPLAAETAAAHEVSAKAEARARIPLDSALPLSSATGIDWAGTDRGKRPAVAVPWAEGLHRAAVIRDAWRDLLRQPRPQIVAGFQEGAQAPVFVTDGWQERFRRPRPPVVIPWGEGKHLGRSLVAPFGVGKPLPLTIRVPWQEARRPPPGISDHGTVTPPGHIPCYNPIPGAPVPLRFWELLSTVDLDLRFRCPDAGGGGETGETVVIPILRAYIVHNDVILRRTSNSLLLKALSLSLSIDSDSWCWGWSASLPDSHLDDVLHAAGDAPVEFEAVVNGVHWLLLGEKVKRDRRFGSGRITLSGRGIAAELGAPYAPAVSRTNSGDLNAQQIMDAALQINGVGIGWTLNWGLVDWLVPAGAWNHTGSHIEAVARVAEAGGGYVQASRAAKILNILPRYPVMPWDWATSVVPDFSLPSAVTTTEGVEWQDNPDYNAVWVSGESSGILAQVLRQGTAGDLAAPMVVDPLNTHADAARQRGSAVLGAAGRMLRQTLETPILPNVGIYPVGSFVEFVDGASTRLGMVRAVSVNANLPRVRQTIEVECHE